MPTFLEVALDNELVLLGVPAADDQVVLAGHKPVELLKPMGLAHMLDGRLGAHLTQLLLGLLLGSFERLLIGVHSLLLLHQVLLALLVVCTGIGICVEVQIQLYLDVSSGWSQMCNAADKSEVGLKPTEQQAQ